MKKVYFVLFCVFGFTAFTSQSQTISYKTESDESDKINLLANFSLLDFNLGIPSISFGAGADVDYYMKRFSVEANYHFTYYDAKKGIIQGTNESENSLKNYGSFRLGGRFHLIDKKGKRKMKAIISSEYVAGGTLTRYLPMKVPCRSIVALHFGIERYHTAIKGKRDSTVTAVDGKQFSEWTSGTNLRVSMLYGGFSFVKIMKTRMSANGDFWNFKYYKHAYIDVMYAPLISIQDIMLGGKSYDVQGKGSKGFATSAIGARFGMNVMSKGGMGIRYEIGVLPGLAGRGLYTTASFGIPLIKSVKQIL